MDINTVSGVSSVLEAAEGPHTTRLLPAQASLPADTRSVGWPLLRKLTQSVASSLAASSSAPTASSWTCSRTRSTGAGAAAGWCT